MIRIIYFDVEKYEEEFLKYHKEGKYDYRLIFEPLNSVTKLSDELLNAEIISVFTTSRLTKEVLEKFPNLKLIALRSVGFNHIDTDYCKEHNIAVENSPNYGNKSVAEFAFGLMLNVCRKIIPAEENYKNMIIQPNELIGTELGGKTVGIIGLGAIGTAFARLAHGFDMKILGYDIYPKQELIEKYSIEYTDFETILQKSDFISLHAPLTKDNFHMFNVDAFKKMKNSAVIINTARGELIDSEALYNAITSREILGAGLDVLESEDTINDFDLVIGLNRLSKDELKNSLINSRLFQLPNVIITPHMAYNTNEAITRILTTTMNNIHAFEQGTIQNSVIR